MVWRTGSEAQRSIEAQPKTDVTELTERRRETKRSSGMGIGRAERSARAARVTGDAGRVHGICVAGDPRASHGRGTGGARVTGAGESMLRRGWRLRMPAGRGAADGGGEETAAASAGRGIRGSLGAGGSGWILRCPPGGSPSRVITQDWFAERLQLGEVHGCPPGVW